MAFAVRAVPESLPGNTLDDPSPGVLVADVSTYANNPGGVVAPLLISAPERVPPLRCILKQRIAATNGRSQRRPSAAVTTIAEAAQCDPSAALHLDDPGIGMTGSMVDAVDVMQRV